VKFFKTIYLKSYRQIIGHYPASTLVRFTGRGAGPAPRRHDDPALGSYGLTCGSQPSITGDALYDLVSFDGKEPQVFGLSEIEPVE
jgi:hypothetical protein